MFEDIRQAARTVISKVFETMFFISVDSYDDDRREEPLKFSSPILRGEIGFKGKYSGKLVLYLSSELAKMMAINFMGLEDNEVPESQRMDVVSELCNVICGNLFSQFRLFRRRRDWWDGGTIP